MLQCRVLRGCGGMGGKVFFFFLLSLCVSKKTFTRRTAEKVRKEEADGQWEGDGEENKGTLLKFLSNSFHF